MEVSGRYSNPPLSPVDLGKLELARGRKAPKSAIRGHQHQAQRRLGSTEITDLVRAYRLGASIDQLAEAFGVNRTTVNAHLDREGMDRPRRLGKLSFAQIQEAGEQYLAGASITQMSGQLGVDEETLRRALRRPRKAIS